jgi:hypothetical protein
MGGITINISWEWALGIIGTLILIAWKTSARFTAIETSLDWIADRIKDLKIEIDNMKNPGFKNGSPVALTDKGQKWLTDSGLKKYIDSNRSHLIESCSTKKETNAYEVQQHIFTLFENMEFDKEADKKFKQYAYEEGISMEVLRRIGAIYFRDICLENFKMDLQDLDRNVS